MVETQRKPKIPTQCILSDDCMVEIGQIVENGEIIQPGVEYPVHQGEWVEVIPVLTIAEITTLSEMRALTQDDDGAKVGDAFHRLCASLSLKIVAWNWTDMLGEPYPQPFRNPEVLENLTPDEIVWLVGAITERETGEQRKNDFGASPTT